MSDQPLQEAGQDPAPGAAPVPGIAARSRPSQEVPVPNENPKDEPAGDLSSRAAQLEAELAKIRAQAVQGAKTMLRVLEPHIEFRHGSRVVGSDPTPVPATAVPSLMEAAQRAGVTIEEVS
jgi:hypothetical protein